MLRRAKEDRTGRNQADAATSPGKRPRVKKLRRIDTPSEAERNQTYGDQWRKEPEEQSDGDRESHVFRSIATNDA
jgi:hypothetical protein